jgi:hypothetical protein
VGFNLDDYEPVASRVQRFYEAYPQGAIHSEIVYDDGKRIVIKATVYRNVTDPLPAAIDYAEEHLTDRGVNATSRIENCCTSAVGRAISVAALGLGPSDYTKKPTREEMGKVQRMSQGTDKRMPEVRITQPDGIASEKQINYIKSLLKAAGHLRPANLDSITKGEASAMVDALKAGTYEPPVNSGEEPF